MVWFVSTGELIATWGGISVSALIAVAAFVVSVLSLSAQRESARAATVSAESAQRANWLTEQRLLREQRDGKQQGESNTSAERRHSDVRWLLDRRGKNTFVLRNVGSDVAEEVRIPAQTAATVSRNLPESATLRPNESVEFMMLGAWGAPIPNEIVVMSNGYPDGQVVPVPGG